MSHISPKGQSQPELCQLAYTLVLAWLSKASTFTLPDGASDDTDSQVKRLAALSKLVTDILDMPVASKLQSLVESKNRDDFPSIVQAALAAAEYLQNMKRGCQAKCLQLAQDGVVVDLTAILPRELQPVGHVLQLTRCLAENIEATGQKR